MEEGVRGGGWMMKVEDRGRRLVDEGGGSDG